MTTVEAIDLSVQFHRAVGLRGIHLHASAGEQIALFGPGGCGKTTLLRVLAGLTPPTSGTVRVQGRIPRAVKTRIGVVLEPISGTSQATPSQVVAKSLSDHDVPGYQRAGRATEALELLGIYAERDVPMRELGGTSRTCTAIAAALAHRPAVLLIDNVTHVLPDALQADLRRFLDDRRAVDGLTVVHATTSSNEAETASCIALMDSGVMLAVATPSELRDRFCDDSLIIEATDPDSIRRTLRGIFNVVLEEEPDGLRVSVPEAVSAVAHLFRHPGEGLRSVFIRRQSMWDIHDVALKRQLRTP